MPAPYLLKKDGQQDEDNEICLFGQTNFRNQMRRFGIKKDDRRRHMYIIGKTGMGKSTMMENMILHDIYKGDGVGLVDPHGDFAEKIINYIPSHRMNDVVYLNPSDLDYPVGFNILEVKNEEQKHLIVAGLMATFKKIWPDVWSARMEYILNNTLLALLEYPGSTLLGINRMLSEKAFRKKVLRKVTDPVIKGFWHNEFENYEPRYQKEAVAPIQNKIGQFLSASVIRNMVAQVKSTVDIREAMDSGKILIMNLSKGRIGEDNSRLLGGMLITKIQLAAMERVDMPESERRDFFLYVDEFQNFATPSFANILSEARKYRLGLIMAHQYVAQLDEEVADAVFGNVGTIVSFRVGAGDAELLAKEFAPTFLEEDIVNLSKFSILLKLMIDGVASLPFSSGTLPPIGSPTGSAEKVIRVSRERYATRRAAIEEKIMRWSGLEPATDDDDEEDVAPEARPDTQPKKSSQDKRKGSVEKKESPTKKQERAPEEKKKISSEPVSDVTVDMPEETVSLTSLIPETSIVEPLREPSLSAPEEREADVTPPVSSSPAIPSISFDTAPVEKHMSTKNGEETNDAAVPKKKKRKRKRRKKKNKDENSERSAASAIKKVSGHVVKEEKHAPEAPPQPADTSETPLQQNNVIRFD
ncbi:MAG: hypothetical protein COU33_04420 [Candidatus Magasanikbacteria bacterium CG10_big_fil_rev_8_21_14_0_10_43_6]|uniref:Type IV secretion system coupling protein TraD DNA-binding domain-containing protein n=1 Tax=Candidatus Magasanikbacteria bacterium CG10_big_fil_rev_8_21_14_0_10_43_6 TaxID=1974650 RepID=A0A2M6W079_9BACT|nr:MAG: hypothetical protein COU33_04420 [Candidatus Magasanikbacteria bacterium CG10_big_fil_rev_8_21_14_0_10_43_6]